MQASDSCVKLQLFCSKLHGNPKGVSLIKSSAGGNTGRALVERGQAAALGEVVVEGDGVNAPFDRQRGRIKYPLMMSHHSPRQTLEGARTDAGRRGGGPG